MLFKIMATSQKDWQSSCLMLLDETGLEHLNAFETLATKTARENQNYNSKKNIRNDIVYCF